MLLVICIQFILQVCLGQIAILMNGGPGSAKSSSRHDAISSMGLFNNMYISIIDPDDIMMNSSQIRWFHDVSNICQASNQTIREQTKQIKREMFDESLNRKENMLLDGTMDNYGKSIKVIDKLCENNYTIVLIGVTMDIDRSLYIAHKRALKTGRHIPMHVIIDSHQMHSQNFAKYIEYLQKNNYDKINVSLYDTNTRNFKQLIVKKSEYSIYNDALILHNLSLYNNFVHKQYMSMHDILNNFLSKFIYKRLF